MKHADEVLADELLVAAVYEALATHCRNRGQSISETSAVEGRLHVPKAISQTSPSGRQSKRALPFN
jgi:hypothetical protein